MAVLELLSCYGADASLTQQIVRLGGLFSILLTQLSLPLPLSLLILNLTSGNV